MKTGREAAQQRGVRQKILTIKGSIQARMDWHLGTGLASFLVPFGHRCHQFSSDLLCTQRFVLLPKETKRQKSW